MVIRKSLHEAPILNVRLCCVLLFHICLTLTRGVMEILLTQIKMDTLRKMCQILYTLSMSHLINLSGSMILTFVSSP